MAGMNSRRWGTQGQWEDHVPHDGAASMCMSGFLLVENQSFADRA